AEDGWTNLDDRCCPSRIGCTGDEVGGIVVCISGAVVVPQDRSRVARRRGVCSFSAVCACAVADEIGDVSIAEGAIAFERIKITDKRDLAGRAAHVDITRDIRCGQWQAWTATRAEGDQIILTRSDRAAERLSR